MIALAVTTLVSSLLGSLHCVAMCGPLTGLHGGIRTMRLAAMHALGRLATYVGLGVAAACVGRAIDLAGDLGSVQRAATLVAAGLVIGWGVYALVTARGFTGPGNGTLFRRGLVQIRSRHAARRAWLVGALTGLLPCGWLWAFVITAGGTANPFAGGAVMAMFWLGTVPAMTGVLVAAGPAIDRLRARMPAIAAVAVIAIGVGTLAMRWRDAGPSGVAHPSCHQVAS